jgi:hypothetical protein
MNLLDLARSALLPVTNSDREALEERGLIIADRCGMDFQDARRQAERSTEEKTLSKDEAARERRYAEATALLERFPGSQRAICVDHETDPNIVYVTVALRGHCVAELSVKRDRYDAFALLEMIERHGTVH